MTNPTHWIVSRRNYSEKRPVSRLVDHYRLEAILAVAKTFSS